MESGLLLDVYGSVHALIPSNRSLVRSSILRPFVPRRDRCDESIRKSFQDPSTDRDVTQIETFPNPPSKAQLTVVRKSSAILELLAGEDQSLLVWRDTLLVLDLGLDIVDGVGRLNLEGDGLAREAIC